MIVCEKTLFLQLNFKNSTMKTTKLTCLALGLLLTASLASCQKEQAGVYSPKNKIQRIYYASGGHEKEPFQHWDWNGDQLSSITHYEDFDFKKDVWIENFTYENNRVVRVDNFTNSEYITYEYDGDHLKTATVYFRNAIACTWAISYDGDHINKMVGTFFTDYKKNRAEMHLDPLSHLLTPKVCERIQKCERQMAEQRRHEETYSFVLLFTWSGDNISKIVFTGDGEYLDFQLQYDDMNCPWFGFLGGLEDFLINYVAGHTGFTKHNLTSMIVKKRHYIDTICFAYQYNSDKYPILQTMYESDDIDYKSVLYFEY